ncbi:MAG TPA: hypothetical protein VFF43_23670 [Caldimonas sp.]|nr:hypothetical protein [Caldimonas sp.]
MTTFAEPVAVPFSRTAEAARAEPPRMDIYASIHKAMRSFMADTLVRIGSIDVADASDRDATLAQLDLLLDLCLGHLRHENECVHTAIEARQPAGSRRIADEHVEHVDAIAELRAEAALLRGATGTEADRIAARLYRHFALFVAENFQHMHVEETAHNALLWQHYSDSELAALHGRILANITPAEHLVVARWMIPASTPGERAVIIAGAKMQMPPEALLGMMAVVRPHMDGSGWTKLTAAAGIDPQLGRW